MQRLNIALLIIIVLLACTGCRPNKNPEKLKANFYKHQQALDQFVFTLQNDKLLDSLFGATYLLKIDELKNSYPDLYKSLTNAGIEAASSCRRAYPKKAKWYFIKTNWRSEYPIYLKYDRYDSIQTVKRYYNKDEVSNETWGLGDNWFMFRWVKDKPYKQ